MRATCQEIFSLNVERISWFWVRLLKSRLKFIWKLPFYLKKKADPAKDSTVGYISTTTTIENSVSFIYNIHREAGRKTTFLWNIFGDLEILIFQCNSSQLYFCLIWKYFFYFNFHLISLIDCWDATIINHRWWSTNNQKINFRNMQYRPIVSFVNF